MEDNFLPFFNILRNFELVRIIRNSFLCLSFLILNQSFVQAQGWYDNNWSYRKEITIDYTKVGSTGAPHKNFAFLISLNADSDLSANALSSGYDILFTADDGTTKMDYERESYSSGTLLAWVNVPSLSATSNTIIYLYYGNSSASDQQNVTAAWDNNFVGVWHLGGNFNDATGSNNLTNTGTGSTTGVIGGGRTFDGSNDYIHKSISDYRSGDTKGSMSVWFKTTERDVALFSSMDDATNWSRYIIFFVRALSGNGYLQVTERNAGTQDGMRNQTNVSDNNWHLATLVSNGSSWSIYLDGTSQSLASAGGNTGDWFSSSTSRDNISIGVGDCSNDAYWFNGSMDEMRITDTALTAGWILTEYNNQSSPGTSYSLGSETLPVELLNFDATWIESGALLKWSTASEVNNDYFSIEKSTDGINFNEIARITGNGTSSRINSYEYLDQSLRREEAYYRLKQVDFNDDFEYSRIVHVRSDLKRNVLVFPNPSTDGFHISNTSQYAINYEITDLVGMNHGRGILSSGAVLRFDPDALASGMYKLILYSNHESRTQTIIVK